MERGRALWSHGRNVVGVSCVFFVSSFIFSSFLILVIFLLSSLYSLICFVTTAPSQAPPGTHGCSTTAIDRMCLTHEVY